MLLSVFTCTAIWFDCSGFPSRTRRSTTSVASVINASCTLVLSRADVSRNFIPYSRASCSPCCRLTCLMLSRSHLLPMRILLTVCEASARE